MLSDFYTEKLNSVKEVVSELLLTDYAIDASGSLHLSDTCTLFSSPGTTAETSCAVCLQDANPDVEKHVMFRTLDSYFVWLEEASSLGKQLSTMRSTDAALVLISAATTLLPPESLTGTIPSPHMLGFRGNIVVAARSTLEDMPQINPSIGDTVWLTAYQNLLTPGPIGDSARKDVFGASMLRRLSYAEGDYFLLVGGRSPYNSFTALANSDKVWATTFTLWGDGMEIQDAHDTAVALES